MDTRTFPFQTAKVLPFELVRNCRVLPERAAILPHLPRDIVFAEIGVAFGAFTEQVLKACAIKQFLAIDTFVLHHHPDVWDGFVGRELNGLKHRDYFERKFASELEAERLTVMEGFSRDKLEELGNKGVDVFYLDADHTYEAVKADLAVIKRKITPDGIIIINDYIFFDHRGLAPFGVIQAANEFMIEERWEMIFFCLHPEMFCDIAIQKVQS
jgi:hypothetical protein